MRAKISTAAKRIIILKVRNVGRKYIAIFVWYNKVGKRQIIRNMKYFYKKWIDPSSSHCSSINFKTSKCTVIE